MCIELLRYMVQCHSDCQCCVGVQCHDIEGGGSAFLSDVWNHSPNDTGHIPDRQNPQQLLWEPRKSHKCWCSSTLIISSILLWDSNISKLEKKTVQFESEIFVGNGNNYPTRCNNIQFIYICKLLYMFQVVFHPSSGAHNTVSTVSGIIETVTATCRECGWMRTSSHPATFSSNGLINARYCRYSVMSSRWWVEIPPETCRAVYRYK